ncbi:hypothetical protein BD779DRAFT_1470538 [Infundibulicybe gibba]|nr:hypothetical protein BD779DRAFT_1470538 [Infundibulicybe gibba]
MRGARGWPKDGVDCNGAQRARLVLFFLDPATFTPKAEKSACAVERRPEWEAGPGWLDEATLSHLHDIPSIWTDPWPTTNTSCASTRLEVKRASFVFREDTPVGRGSRWTRGSSGEKGQFPGGVPTPNLGLKPQPRGYRRRMRRMPEHSSESAGPTAGVWSGVGGSAPPISPPWSRCCARIGNWKIPVNAKTKSSGGWFDGSYKVDIHQYSTTCESKCAIY